MKSGKPYRLQREGNLLILRAAVGGMGGSVTVLRLLLDTGASYTMLPVEAVEALGCDTHHPLRRVRIVAANGIIVAPVVSVRWLHCLGRRLEEWPVVAHTLPQGAFVDGLLGMDFLTHVKATISVSTGEILYEPVGRSE
jgi:aspartyl protease family protein